MGYYTVHTLDILEGDRDLLEKHEKEIEELSGYGIDAFGSSVKWYHMEDDMKEYSKKYPDTVFEVHGEGEEHHDEWYHFFKNGRSKFEKTKIVVTYDEYDESKLKL